MIILRHIYENFSIFRQKDCQRRFLLCRGVEKIYTGERMADGKEGIRKIKLTERLNMVMYTQNHINK